MRELMSKLDFKRGVSPVAAGTDNTAVTSQIIDTLGYDSLTFAIILGANTDTNATFAVTMAESDDSGMSGSNAVAAGDIAGTLALASFTAAADDNKIKKVGYLGNKRYVQLTITPTGNDSGNIFLAVLAILGNAHLQPSANPPA